MIRQTTKTDFHAAMTRIKDATGATTQEQLAEILGIRQSSISDAKRRGSIPADWLLKLFRQFGLNPEWVLEGKGAMFPEFELVDRLKKLEEALEWIAENDFYTISAGCPGSSTRFQGDCGKKAQAVLDEADKMEPIVEYPLAADPNKVVCK